MLKQFKDRRQAGDTLIEVLFAVTVFSLVVVTSLTLMNQGTSASIRALQITLVRQEIDSQADALRFLNSAYVAAYYRGYAPAPTPQSPAQQYYTISKDAETARLAGKTSVTQFGGGSSACQAPPNGSFVINTRTGLYQKNTTTNALEADTFSQVAYDAANVATAKGIWIEAVKSAPSNGTGYTDYHIRACWYAPGAGQAMNLGTIVRLYEPTN